MSFWKKTIALGIAALVGIGVAGITVAVFMRNTAVRIARFLQARYPGTLPQRAWVELVSTAAGVRQICKVLLGTSTHATPIVAHETSMTWADLPASIQDELRQSQLLERDLTSDVRTQLDL